MRRRRRRGRVTERAGFMVVVVVVVVSRERKCWLRGAAGKGEKNMKDGRLWWLMKGKIQVCGFCKQCW